MAWVEFSSLRRTQPATGLPYWGYIEVGPDFDAWNAETEPGRPWNEGSPQGINNIKSERSSLISLEISDKQEIGKSCLLPCGQGFSRAAIFPAWCPETIQVLEIPGDSMLNHYCNQTQHRRECGVGTFARKAVPSAAWPNVDPGNGDIV